MFIRGVGRIVYFLGFGSNIFTLFPRLFGKLSLVNMAGVEWERSKFNKVERSLLKFFIFIICNWY